MSVGLRIRGSSGNVQVDETSPVFVVREQGSANASNYLREGDGGMYSSRHHVRFGTAMTTQEPPLIFIRFTVPYVYMSTFTMIGTPGAWTGFNIGLGVLAQNANFVAPAPMSFNWFSAGKILQASPAKVGLRVRNRQTGEIVFDSGYRLVKFVRQDSDFRSLGRVTHYLLRYGVGYPAGDVYFLANNLAGVINYYGGTQYSCMWPGLDPSFPNTLLLHTYGINSSIPYQSNLWNVLFASPGA